MRVQSCTTIALVLLHNYIKKLANSHFRLGCFWVQWFVAKYFSVSTNLPLKMAQVGNAQRLNYKFALAKLC